MKNETFIQKFDREQREKDAANKKAITAFIAVIAMSIGVQIIINL